MQSLVASFLLAVPAVLGLGAMPAIAADAALERNKDVVERFFTAANAGDVKALQGIVREDYVEHADLPDRLTGLAQTIVLNVQSPKADAGEERQRIRGDIVRMIAERDHVWTYSQVRGAAGRVARVDMFRLDSGRIAEHWAVVEQVNEERRNANDQFAAGAGPRDYTRQPRRTTATVSEAVAGQNRTVARLFYQYFEVRDDAALRTIMHEDYIQHNATIPSGREGLLVNMPAFRARVAEEAKRRAEAGEPPVPAESDNEIIRLLTEGDFVWVFIRDSGGKRAQFNQYRVADGMLVEHWGTYQDIPAVRQNANTFFGFGRGPAPDYSR